jgi:hypothetical protein
MQRLLVTAVSLFTLSALAQTNQRSYVAGNFQLSIQGVEAGELKAFSGGDTSADVIEETVGTGPIAKKHIGNPKYNDIILQVPPAMPAPLHEWIKSSWNAIYVRKDGSIVTSDYTFEKQSEREFFHALITETTIPACDAASKEPAYLGIKFSPEYTRYKKASGKMDSVSSTASAWSHKQWLPSNFRLAFPGLETSRVTKIDALTVKSTPITVSPGETRDPQKEPGKLDFPNLKITFSEVSLDSWQSYFDDFVIAGNASDDQEKDGSLELLDLYGSPLLTVRLQRCGIYRLVADGPGFVRAEMYCERLSLD